jgi:hypothetical protein
MGALQLTAAAPDWPICRIAISAFHNPMPEDVPSPPARYWIRRRSISCLTSRFAFSPTAGIESAFVAPDVATQQIDGKFANHSVGRQLAHRCICCNTTTSLPATQQADEKK